MLQPPAIISGLLMGEGYLHSNEAVTCKRGNTEVFRRNIWELFRRKGTGRELVDMSIAYHGIIAVAGTQVTAVLPAVTPWD